jgi:predicted nucleic acid-binding protein
MQTGDLTDRMLGRHVPLVARAIGSKFEKQWPDAMSIEVARARGLRLVTADRAQARAAREFGVTVES